MANETKPIPREAVVIKWYRKRNYGVEHEYIHPESAGDAGIISQLTGKNTITGVIRELVCDLTRGMVKWEEVLAP